MQSQFNILSALFRVVNVPEVTSVINGKVYIGNPPQTSEKEDVGLNLLNNPNQYLQSGYGNLNIYTEMLAAGRPNISRIKQLIDIIIPLVEDTTITTTDGTFHFQIDDDKGVFEDKDGMCYYNLKLKFQTL